MRRIMRKKLASFMNSKYILIGLSALCLLFIATSFFTDKLTTPLRNAISTVVIPVQRGMNYIGLWISDKYDTLQEISTVLEENKDLQAKVDDLTEENNQLKQDSYELDRLRDLYELKNILDTTKSQPALSVQLPATGIVLLLLIKAAMTALKKI